MNKCMCKCVCMCVCVRERERERETDRQTETWLRIVLPCVTRIDLHEPSKLRDNCYNTGLKLLVLLSDFFHLDSRNHLKELLTFIVCANSSLG